MLIWTNKDRHSKPYLASVKFVREFGLEDFGPLLIHQAGLLVKVSQVDTCTLKISNMKTRYPLPKPPCQRILNAISTLGGSALVLKTAEEIVTCSSSGWSILMQDG
jgi:hypothetical protein